MAAAPISKSTNQRKNTWRLANHSLMTQVYTTINISRIKVFSFVSWVILLQWVSLSYYKQKCLVRLLFQERFWHLPVMSICERVRGTTVMGAGLACRIRKTTWYLVVFYLVIGMKTVSWCFHCIYLLLPILLFLWLIQKILLPLILSAPILSWPKAINIAPLRKSACEEPAL